MKYLEPQNIKQSTFKAPLKNRILSLLLLFTIYIFHISAVFATPENDDAKENKEIITLGYNLRVEATDRFIDEMRAWANQQSGYLVRMTSGNLVFRIPVTVGKTAIDLKIKSIPGVSVYRAFRQNNNVNVRIIDQKAKLKVALTNLSKLRELSTKAGLDDLLDLERALNRSLSQVDRLKGEINYLEQSAALYNLTLHINATNATSDSKTIPIPWIRSLTLQNMNGVSK